MKSVKNEVRRLNKCVIEVSNSKLRQKLNTNQRKNRKNVITGSRRRKTKTLAIFYIKYFYLFIKVSLLKQFLDFAKNCIKVSNENKATIKHARKPLLFKDQKTRI